MKIFFLFFQNVKINLLTREEKNAYFDTTLTRVPKSDEPQYCNKKAKTTKATDFNYQSGVGANLRGINTKCVAYNASFLCCHDEMEWM